MTPRGTVLIIDDVLENRKLVAAILTQYTDYTIWTAADGMAVSAISPHKLPDLILLDIMMPQINGYEVARKLRENDLTRLIPVIFLTSKADTNSKIRGFQQGGVDYITKPFNKDELLARVNAHIRLKNFQDELKIKNKMLADREVHLRHLVEEKTQKIENVTIALVTALEDANLANDGDTGNHIKRVSAYAALLASAYGTGTDYVKRIKLFASLHDVGKVGITDAILKKPGQYTSGEFNLIKQHVIIGGKLLDNPAIDLMARNIALYHHEKWDGSGYCAGLAGDKIPLEARIVALADVYDALSNKRIYKPAFGRQKVEIIIAEERGKHFDPQIADIFFEQKDSMFEIRRRYKDKE
jgi:putative two-component system response regulator